MFFNPKTVNWNRPGRINNRAYCCGYCGNQVSTDRGYAIGMGADGDGPQSQRAGIYICPNCSGPTFFNVNGFFTPSVSHGNSVSHVPEQLNSLYEEARRSTSKQCYTGAVLLCRKALMNIAVEQGANENLRFIEYVNFLAENGYIPPNGRHWVDHIRRKGNEATHEIALMTADDAKDLINFLEMLLKFIYEFPAKVPLPE